MPVVFTLLLTSSVPFPPGSWITHRACDYSKLGAGNATWNHSGVEQGGYKHVSLSGQASMCTRCWMGCKRFAYGSFLHITSCLNSPGREYCKTFSEIWAAQCVLWILQESYLPGWWRTLAIARTQRLAQPRYAIARAEHLGHLKQLTSSCLNWCYP
jgi:hypothetical protein